MSKIAKKRKRLNIISNVYAFLVYALLYIPVAVMMVFSFNDQKYNYYWNGFTTQWYAKLFTNSTLVDSLIYSLIIAVLSTLISVFIGTIGALGLKRYEFKMKKFIDNMLYIPIIVPEIVLAVALLIIFLKVGVSMGMGTILIGHCTFCIPYAIVTIKGRISGRQRDFGRGQHGSWCYQGTDPASCDPAEYFPGCHECGIPVLYNVI